MPDSSVSSSASEAATAAGTSRPVSEISAAEANSGARAGGPGQLLKVEGVSPALLVKESGAGHVEPLAEKLPGLIQGKSAEVNSVAPRNGALAPA